MGGGYLWVAFTIVAATAQVLRNSAQAGLTQRIGTLGATQVRFVFGFPFAIVFLLGAVEATGDVLPDITTDAMGWILLGAMSQILATALMLVAMSARGFGVAYAYIKTEPVLVALLGVLLLGDLPTALGWMAIVVVTCGVVLAATPPGQLGRLIEDLRPAGIGIASGAFFGLSAIAFRGSIEALPAGSFLMRSMVMLAISLGAQTLLLGLWLALRDRAAFAGSLREWRASTGAGFLGALASAG